MGERLVMEVNPDCATILFAKIIAQIRRKANLFIKVMLVVKR